MNLSDVQKVLVADDDGLSREVLGALLKPEYSVLLAKNGAQALERATRHVPDLVLLDVVMPDMDGYEVLRRLRADPRTEHISVIFISGLDRPEDEAIGLKLGASDYITKPFNSAVVLARVAVHLEVLRQRRMLERLANIDGLTELANRRRFDELFAGEWQRARRSGQPLSLALLDIDCFKQFNDQYGHAAGDRALRAVARIAAGGMRRPGDLAARYGGEEIALLMPDTCADKARQVMEWMCQSIAQLAMAHETSMAARILTASAGGATLDPAGIESCAELFEAADSQLYQAKAAGRNRVLWRGMAGGGNQAAHAEDPDARATTK
jgi:diguanylate cyclase (GGDEF)-like protein